MDIEIQDKILDRLIRDVEIARTHYENGLSSYVDFVKRIEFVRDTGYRLVVIGIFDDDTQLALVEVIIHIKDNVIRYSY